MHSRKKLLYLIIVLIIVIECIFDNNITDDKNNTRMNSMNEEDIATYIGDYANSVYNNNIFEYSYKKWGEESVSMHYIFKNYLSYDEYEYYAISELKKIQAKLSSFSINNTKLLISPDIHLYFYITKEIVDKMIEQGNLSDKMYYSYPYKIGGVQLFEYSGIYNVDQFNEYYENGIISY